jgi:hypothetical protein
MKRSIYFIQMIIAVSLIVLLSVVYGRSLILVMEYTAFIAVFLFMLIPVIFIYGVPESLSFFGTAFNQQATVKEKRRAISFFKSMTIYTILASVPASIAVICYMLGNLGDSSSLGPFLAFSLLSVGYACFCCLVLFLPLWFFLEKDLVE